MEMRRDFGMNEALSMFRRSRKSRVAIGDSSIGSRVLMGGEAWTVTKVATL